MILDVTPLRRAMEATPGDAMQVGKDQLEAMFQEIEAGQAARRELKMVGAVASITVPGAQA